MQSVQLSSFSPPASRCSSPTRVSRMSPSGVRRAKLIARKATVLVASSGSKPRPCARSAGKKQRFLSSPRRGVRSIAENVFSNGGRWVPQRQRHNRSVRSTAGLKPPWNSPARTEPPDDQVGESRRARRERVTESCGVLRSVILRPPGRIRCSGKSPLPSMGCTARAMNLPTRLTPLARAC